jgi:hypothetical protein
MLLTRTTLKIVLLLLPIGILLFLAVPKFRAALHISQSAEMVFSLALLAVIAVAVITQTVTEGHVLPYDTVVLGGAAGIVFLRVSRHLRARRRP